MVPQVDAAPGDGGSGAEGDDGADEALGAGEGAGAVAGVAGRVMGRLVPDEEEEDEREGPEEDELGVGGGHAVAFSVDAARALFLDQALEGEVGGFAAELAQKHQGDFDLAGRPDKRHVDDAEGLGEKGQPGTEEGEGIFGILGGGDVG